MGSDAYFLKECDLSAFVGCLPAACVHGTVADDKGGRSSYERITEDTAACLLLGGVPPLESMKGFVFPLRQCVAVYPGKAGQGGGSEDTEWEDTSEEGLPGGEQGGPAGQEDVGSGEQDGSRDVQIAMGGRACDLGALGILDKVFLENDIEDPFYRQRRDNLIIITSDCVEPVEGCFCNLVGGQPYADVGFDLNMSVVTDGYVVIAGSDRGKGVLEKAKSVLKEATAEQLAERDERRAACVKMLQEQNREFDAAVGAGGQGGDGESSVGGQVDVGSMEELAGCVECGACSFICPTCHCFFIYDQSARAVGQNERWLAWDSCVAASYAKMAGVGGVKPTPRPELSNRLENRIRHKFEWMVRNLGVVGCVGCGRCIEACLGGSDVRDLFKKKPTQQKGRGKKSGVGVSATKGSSEGVASDEADRAAKEAARGVAESADEDSG